LKNRIELIDVAKGISIILVALHHSHLATYFGGLNSAMGLFRVPLFFFLSGVFFNPLDNPRKFFFKKTDGLLKPYFATLFIILFLSLLLGEKDILQQAAGIFYGNGHTIRWPPLWFLTHLWCVSMITFAFFYLTEIGKFNPLQKLFLILTLLITGCLLVARFWQMPLSIFRLEFKLPGFPFSSDLVPLSMAFYISGYFLHKKVKAFRPRLSIFFPAMILLIVIAVFTGALVNLNVRVLREPVFATLAAVSGIYCILSISYCVCKTVFLKRILLACGVASLFILLFHWYIENKFHELLVFIFDGNFQPAISSLSFGVCIFLPVLIRKVFSRVRILKTLYFPTAYEVKGTFSA